MENVLKLINISLIIILIYCQGIASNDKSYVRKLNVGADRSNFPAHKDLLGYLNSLERIIFFFLINKKYLDLNCLFGLFLVNVNLKRFTNDRALPLSIRSYLNYLLVQTDDLQKLRFHEDYASTWNKIASLFTNDTAWSKRMTKLDLDSPSNIDLHRFPKWSKYQRAVDDLENSTPHPKLSDLCLQSLAENDENQSKYSQVCELPIACCNALMLGTNYGYALTHRLLILLEARLSRGCYIFSVPMDELMRRSFCDWAYSEAEYNAVNGFKNVDIMFEQMALCTLDGHGKFLRKSWLSSLIRHQTPWGCFNETQISKNFFERTSQPDENQCSGHVTAVAAATLAAAIRYILENY